MSKIVVLCGLGGAGKSQLMLNYIKNFQQDYTAVFWIDAGSKAKLETDYRRIKRLLLGSHGPDIDMETCVFEMRQWFQCHHGPYLFVMDSADDIDVPDYAGFIDLHKLIMDASSADVVITTRSQIAKDMTSLEAVQVAELDLKEARELFLRRSKLPNPTPELHTEIDEVTQELGYFALAINIAAAYVSETPRLRLHPGKYLDEYRRRRETLLARPPKPQIDQYEASVLATWETSYAAIRESCPEACNLLALLAFLAPNNIPLEMFEVGDSTFAELHLEILETASSNASLQQVLESSLAILVSYSLLQWSDGLEHYSMHKLVHAWSHDRLDFDARATFCAAVCDYLATFEPSRCTRPAMIEHFASHAMYCFAQSQVLCQADHMAKSRVVNSLDKLSMVCYSLGRYHLAYELLLFVYEHYEQHDLGAPVEYLETLLHLGNLHFTRQDSEMSEKRLRQALYELDRPASQSCSTLRLQCPYLLATTLAEAGKDDQSDEMFRELIAERNQTKLNAPQQYAREQYGLKGAIHHGGMLVLADSLKVRRKHREAQILYIQVMSDCANIPEHRRIALQCRTGLVSSIYRQIGSIKAIDLYRQVTSQWPPVYGLIRPIELETIHHLGVLLFEQGALKEAQDLFERAFHELEKTVGIMHDNTLTILTWLATTLRHRNSYDRALALFTRAADKLTKLHGDGRPETRWCYRQFDGLRAFLNRRTAFKEESERTSLQISANLARNRCLEVSLESGWESEGILYRRWDLDSDDGLSDEDSCLDSDDDWSDDDWSNEDRCQSLSMDSRRWGCDSYGDDLRDRFLSSNRTAFKQEMQRASIRIAGHLEAGWHIRSFWNQEAAFKEEMEQASSRIAGDLEAGRHMDCSRRGVWKTDLVVGRGSESWLSDSDYGEWWDTRSVDDNWKLNEYNEV